MGINLSSPLSNPLFFSKISLTFGTCQKRARSCQNDRYEECKAETHT